MVGIRIINVIRAANQAMAYTVPVRLLLATTGSISSKTLASVLAFVTYASTHVGFEPVGHR